MVASASFDGAALIAALDAQRVEHELDQAQLADELHDQSHDLDAELLHEALDAERRERWLTWAALAEEMGCTPARLTNLRGARLADMALVLQVTQWLRRPAADFVEPARW